MSFERIPTERQSAPQQEPGSPDEQVVERSGYEGGPMSRYLAADMLREVADMGEAGLPPGIPIEHLGRALYRIVSNLDATDDELLGGLVRGFLQR